MRRAIITALALLGLGAPCLAADPAQGPPDFGIDTSGVRRNLNIRDATLGARVPMGYIDTTTHTYASQPANAVEAYGAKGDSNGTTGNGTNDTAAIEACVAGGRVCVLRPGATYRLMSAVDIPSGGGLVGDKTATLYCDPAGINNTSLLVPDRYLQTSSCIQAAGNPAALAGVILKDFKINWGGSANRCCQAVNANHATNMTIDGLEIYNLSGYAIRYASWAGGRITNNYIHDATNDTGAELAGIQGDNEEFAGQESTDVLIAGNRISNMLVSQTGYNNTFTDATLPDGYQPNAIKLLDGDRIKVIGNSLDHTGQCIDGYLTNSIIANNTTNYCLNIGISLKHTNHDNVVANNSVNNSGGAGIVVIGDPTDTSYNNVVSGNVVTNIGEDDWTGFTSTLLDTGNAICIFNWSNTTNNTYSGNSCDPGTTIASDYDWRDTSGGDRNSWVNNVVVRQGNNGEWLTGDGAGFASSINGSQQRVYGRVPLGDSTLLGLANRASPTGDGQAALMEFSSADQLGARSVAIGDVDKPTTGAHCFTVRTSNGAVPAERTFTCLGTVIGTPTGGTNGDMGGGSLNAQSYYQNGVQFGPPVYAGTPVPSATFGGGSTGMTLVPFARNVTIGSQVFFEWSIQFTAKGSSTGTAVFDGLPATALNGIHVPCSVHFTNMTAGVGDTDVSCLVLGNTTTVALFKIGAGVNQQLTAADFTDTSILHIAGTYFAN